MSLVIFGPTRTLAWHWFHCRVPADWEVTAYHKEATQGRLLLETRSGLQAEVNWQTIAKRREPDLARMLEANNPAPAAEPRRDWETARIGRFQLGWRDQNGPLHAATFLAEAGVALFWVFCQATADARHVRDVLDSFAVNTGAVRRWAAWGCDFFLPETYELEEVQALPLQVTLRFATSNHHQVLYTRLAMPALLLGRETLESFHRSWLSQSRRTTESVASAAFRGLQASRAVFRTRGEAGLEQLLGRDWHGESLLWHDPAEARLHCLVQFGPAALKHLMPDDIFRAD